MRYVSRGDRLAFWILAVLALVGVLGALSGGMPWWPGVFFAACAVGLLLGSDLPRFVDDIEVSAQGVRRTYGPRLWVKKVEAISWDALSKVEIVADRLDAEEVSFLLYGSDGRPMPVSDAQAETEGLVMEMQKRLPDFDERRFDEACQRVRNGPTLVWEKPASGQVGTTGIHRSP
jgi:hypothetical protein